MSILFCYWGGLDELDVSQNVHSFILHKRHMHSFYYYYYHIPYTIY